MFLPQKTKYESPDQQKPFSKKLCIANALEPFTPWGSQSWGDNLGWFGTGRKVRELKLPCGNVLEPTSMVGSAYTAAILQCLCHKWQVHIVKFSAYSSTSVSQLWLQIIRLIEKSLVYETWVGLPCVQGLMPYPGPEPDECVLTSHFFKIHSDFVLPSVPWSNKWLFLSKLKYHVYFLSRPCVLHASTSRPHVLISSVICEEYRFWSSYCVGSFAILSAWYETEAEIQISRDRKPPHSMTSHLNASILKGLMSILWTNKMGQVFNESAELQGAYDVLLVTG